MSLAMKARQRVRKKTVKDKIFGCDLLEHLQMSGQEVPQVLKSCTEFVEEHGIVDGIYRLCGIASNVQKLRQEFDIERPPDLNKSTYLQDVHCVSSLCKAYFRELPNPLLTYQLYDKFADAVAIQLEEQRLIKIREVLKELPLPHYRTLEYLMRHLLRMASHSSQTNMHARNLAIVWAPNLLRSKDIESSGFNGTAAFMEVRVQSIVVEFILTHVEQLFGDWTNYGKENEGNTFASMNWPTCVPEDYYRSLSYNLPNMLNHGDGPPQIRPYHTIIEFSDHKRKGSLKAKKWKSIFNLGRSNPDSKRKSQKQDDKDGKSGKLSLRPAKSMDSLSSVSHATIASDLEQNSLALRSPRNQQSLRRESLGSPSKTENVEFIFLDSEEQLHSMDTNDAEYEEEGQAKSEPTTPKPGRSQITGNPPGRSPKSNPNRAEKCVGVHISGPFSVTLPFHITSNLSRLTRGMECPGLSIMTQDRSSEKFFSLEGNLSAESDDIDKVRLSQMADKDSDKHCGTETVEEPGKENARISLEVQDTFSFLDAQDTSIEKVPENMADSEMLGYELHAGNKMEEFSVEPPPDDLCGEDEAEQAYFMPTGFIDDIGHWRVIQESMEDIYLSANDDLSPITVAPEMILENNESSSEVQQCILHASLPKDAVEETVKEEHPKLHDVSYSQELPLTASETWLQGDEEGQHCNLDRHVSCREEPENSGSSVPNIAEAGITGAQNMSNPENRAAVPAPEQTQCTRIHNRAMDDEEGQHCNLDRHVSWREEPENSGSSVPNIAEAGITGAQNMSNPENRAAVPAPEQTQCTRIHNRAMDDEEGQQCNPDDLATDWHVSCREEPENSGSSVPNIAEAGITGAQNMSNPENRAAVPAPEQTQCTRIHNRAMDDEEGQHCNLDRHVSCREEPENSGSSVPNIAEAGITGAQNMSNPENRAAVPTPEQTQHNHKDDEESGKDDEDSPAPPAGNKVDDTAEHKHDEDMPTSQQPMPHVQHPSILLSKGTLENGDCEDEGLNTKIPDSHDRAVASANPTNRNTSDNCLCRTEVSRTNPSPGQLETVETQSYCTEERFVEDTESIIEDQGCSDEDPFPCLHSLAEDAIRNYEFCPQINIRTTEENLKDSPQSEEPAHRTPSEDNEADLRLPHVSGPPVELEALVPAGMYPDGGVAMKLMATTNKIQQAKSVPIVPPKPQFAKLPPALKSKIHASSSLSANTRSQKTEKSSHMEAPETSDDAALKRRASWRTTTSISFDTAMALAEERQTPVRRIQTYCMGDSYEVMDTCKTDSPPHAPRFTVKSASERAHRPFSCMALSCGEGELHGHNTVEEGPIHGLQSIFTHEPDTYSKEVPQRNRLSMPRLGQPSVADDQSKGNQQRRSLL